MVVRLWSKGCGVPRRRDRAEREALTPETKDAKQLVATRAKTIARVFGRGKGSLIDYSGER